MAAHPPQNCLQVATPPRDDAARAGIVTARFPGVVRPDDSETVLLQEVQIDEFDVVLDWRGGVPPS